MKRWIGVDLDGTLAYRKTGDPTTDWLTVTTWQFIKLWYNNLSIIFWKKYLCITFLFYITTIWFWVHGGLLFMAGLFEEDIKYKKEYIKRQELELEYLNQKRIEK